MSKEILYILLPDFASHEMVYLMETISSDETQLKPERVEMYYQFNKQGFCELFK